MYLFESFEWFGKANDGHMALHLQNDIFHNI